MAEPECHGVGLVPLVERVTEAGEEGLQLGHALADEVFGLEVDERGAQLADVAGVKHLIIGALRIDLQQVERQRKAALDEQGPKLGAGYVELLDGVLRRNLARQVPASGRHDMRLVAGAPLR